MRTAFLFLAVTGLLLAGPALAQDTHDYAAQRIDALLTREYDHKMISSGQNFPAVNMRREQRGDLVLLLREGLPLSSIREHFGWSQAHMQQLLDELVSADLVRRSETGGYIPTLMVMSLGDVARHMPVPDVLVREAAQLIVRHLPEVRSRYSAVEGFLHVPFDAASLLVLSDVLLDNWQINGVERGFLNAKRPLRAGSRYYYSIQERTPSDTREAFGIYGNQYRHYGPFTVGVYGNRRVNNELNFIDLGGEELESLFGTKPGDVGAFKEELLNHLVAAARDPDVSMPPRFKAGLAALGWLEGELIRVPLLDTEGRAALSAMASLVTDDLLALLEHYRPEVTKAYEASPYAREITFEEYFMWWYHLFYTDVTDRLIFRGHIAMPAAGITTYLLVPDA